MAPEHAVLKRKRSRPSDYWIVSTPPAYATEALQDDHALAKKHKNSSKVDTGRAVQEAPAAANRGTRQNSASRQGTENAAIGDGNVAKQLRSGRLSHLPAEFESVAAAELATGVEGATQRERASVRKANGNDATKSLGNPDFDTGIELHSTPLEVARNEAPKMRRGRHIVARLEGGKLANEPINNNGQGMITRRGRGQPDVPQGKDELEKISRDIAVAKKIRQRPRPVSTTEERATARSHHDAPSQGSSDWKHRHAQPRSMLGPDKQPPDPHEVESPQLFRVLRHGRTSKTQGEVRAIAKIATGSQLAAKKRGRIPESADGSSAAVGPIPESKCDPLSKPLKRGRRSFVDIEVETVPSSSRRNRIASKNIDNISGAVNSNEPKGSALAKEHFKSQLAATHIRQRADSESQMHNGRLASDADRKRKRIEDEEQIEDASKGKRHQGRQEFPEEAATQAEEGPIYQHLAPVTRKVSRETIEAKWEPLAPASVERISQLVHNIQNSIVVHFSDDERTGANTAMHMISRRLLSKASKGLPFPPPIRHSREDDFDFEKILDYNRALEVQLTSALHANELLESELAKEMLCLGSEQASLVELEANAKSEANMRKAAGRRLHSVLHSNSMKEEDLTETMLASTDLPHTVMPLSHTDDENLQEIAQDLNGHLDTIQGNIHRVEGISQAMTMSRAAVQAILLDHVHDGDYDDLVLG